MKPRKWKYGQCEFCNDVYMTEFVSNTFCSEECARDYDKKVNHLKRKNYAIVGDTIKLANCKGVVLFSTFKPVKNLDLKGRYSYILQTDKREFPIIIENIKPIKSTLNMIISVLREPRDIMDDWSKL